MVNSRRKRQTGFCGFDQAITSAIYFTFHNGKKSSFDRPNYTSMQVFHFEVSVKEKRRKGIRFDKQNFFRNFNPIARALRENLCNRSSGVQIPRDICTRFGRYLYSTKCSWIIIKHISQCTTTFLREQLHFSVHKYISQCTNISLQCSFFFLVHKHTSQCINMG